MAIKKDFNFIWFGGYPHGMPMLHYLSMKSCIIKNNPDSITLVCDQEPHGQYWDELKPLVSVELVEIDPALSLKNNSNRERFRLLQERGGVYSDLDMLFVHQIPDSLFDEEFVAGEFSHLKQGQLCDGFLMAAPGSTFLQAWGESVSQKIEQGANELGDSIAGSFVPGLDFDPADYSYRALSGQAFHSVYPVLSDILRVLERKHVDTRKVYGLHLWEHVLKRRKIDIPKNVEFGRGFFAEYANQIRAARI